MGGHQHHQHDARRANRRRFGVLFALSASYMLIEAAGGLWTGSLALLADAGHLLSDVAAIALGWTALWMAQRPATARRTYGHTRSEILAALANGVALVVVAVFIAIEAVGRLSAPPEVRGLGVVAIAAGALLINTTGIWILRDGRHHSLNVRGVWLHLLTDAISSLGAILAGLAIWGLGWRWADPAASLIIASLVLGSAWQLLREAVDVLMEAAPRHLDVGEIRAQIAGLPDVEEVHDLHVWTIGTDEISLSSHVIARATSPTAPLLGRIYALLSERFDIHHSTIQIEPPGYTPLEDSAEGRACPGSCDSDPASAA